MTQWRKVLWCFVLMFARISCGSDVYQEQSTLDKLKDQTMRMRGFRRLAVPIGSEFQVNTYTTSYQSYPATAGLSGGGFVITWQSSGQDGSDYGIYAQRYDSSGVAQGSEFQVNTYSASEQSSSAVAGLSGGGFVITWQSSGQDGSSFGIYAQRYDSSGVAQGSEFRVNTYTTSYQWYPAVAGLSGGGFVITWGSDGQDGSGEATYAQRYDSSGVAQGSEFQVNTYTTSYQLSSTVAGLSGGGFVITWNSDVQDGSGEGIYAQRYDSSGAAQGSEFQVNTYTTDHQWSTEIAGLSGGGFVITWTSSFQDGPGEGIYAQRYDSSGVAQGSEFQVNTYTTSYQWYPAVAGLSGGGFVITWSSDGQDGSNYGIYAQLFMEPTDAPTSLPTSLPSMIPTSIPTSQPSLVPTCLPTTSPPSMVPSSMPSTVPSSMPSMVPSSMPSLIPTFLPSSIPTAQPTSTPTAQPTAAIAEHIAVHLYDLHGDGWDTNLYFSVEHEHGADLYSLECACKVVRIFAGDMSLSFWRNRTIPGPKGDVTPYEWEALWTVSYSDGVTETDFNIVGGVDTKVEIRNYALNSTDSALNVDHRKPENMCVPPKPKPKAHPAHENSTDESSPPDPPSPALEVKLVLMTTSGQRWCDDSGGFSTFACDKENHLSADATLPNLLVYPRYYISRVEDHRMVASGTLRTDETEWVTSVNLLREGSYVFSVSGSYTASSGSVSWDFCGEQGGINERLHFGMVKGICHSHYVEVVDDGLACYESLGALLQIPIVPLQASESLQSWRSFVPVLMLTSGALVILALVVVIAKAKQYRSGKQFSRVDTTEHA